MKIVETHIADVKIVEPRVFKDDRGFFFESFNQKSVSLALNLNPGLTFVQDNHSKSVYGVLRGLHYQLNRPQGKLVRVVHGAAYDVAVDMRRNSNTFGKYVGVHLSAENQRILWIPPGFAHGFLTLSPEVDFLYKTTDYYDPSSEYTLLWNDPEIGIEWPITEQLRLSEKDSKGHSFKNAPTYS